MKDLPAPTEGPTVHSLKTSLLQAALRRDGSSAWLHFTWLLVAIISFFAAIYHVPWRDEAQPWLFARDMNPGDLFFEARHNGHPLLWTFLLKAVQATGANYLGMMILNWVFLISGLWLLFYRSSLPLVARIGIALAPVCLTEVSFIARNYAISAPLCFLAAILYRQAEEKPVRFCLPLALLANTSIFGFALFTGISFQFLLEQATAFGKSNFTVRPLYTKYLWANVILALAALILVAQLVPVHFPGDMTPNVAKPLSFHLANLLSPFLILTFLMPLTLLFFARKSGSLRVLGGIPIVLVATVPALVYACGSRHCFVVLLGVIYFCWIYLDSFVETATYFGKKLSSLGINLLVTFLILLACFGAKPAGFRQALNRPYDSRNAAEAIIERHLDTPKTLMVTTDPFRAMSLFLFLNSIHNAYGPPPFPAEPQSFAHDVYLGIQKPIPTLGEIKPLVQKLARENPGKTILVISMGSKGNLNFQPNDPEYPLDLVYQTPPSPLYGEADESYQVYALRR